MDDGLVGESPYVTKVPSVVLTCSLDEADAMQKSLHETVIASLVSFQVLDRVYRHDPTQHGYVFWAGAVLVELSTKIGDPLFGVNCKVLF